MTDFPDPFGGDGRWMRNRYRCAACDESWSDEWSCACDDECPTCGAAVTAEDSDDLTAETVAADFTTAPFVRFDDPGRARLAASLLALPPDDATQAAFVALVRAECD